MSEPKGSKKKRDKSRDANCRRRYRLYPTEEQAARLTEWGHTCRWLYNIALEQREAAYWSCGRQAVWSQDQCRDRTEMRAELDWFRDLPCKSAGLVLINLDRAYLNWWNKEHPSRRPTAHKRNGSLSIPFGAQQIFGNDNGHSVDRLSRKWGRVRLPKLGYMRFRWSRPLDGDVRNATVVYKAGQWHISFGIHLPKEQVEAPEPNDLPPVGIDFGITCSAFCSDETESRNMPPTLTEGEQKRKLALERQKERQITYAKKHDGGKYSNRLRETIAELAKLEARAARRRKDWNDKFTTDIAKNHGTVVIEDLKVSNMTKSARGTIEKPGHNVKAKRSLSREILNQGFYQRRVMLEYKCKREGGELVAVPPYGTSQTCSACGVRDPESRKGCGRAFACTACGFVAHADHNAAVNILNRGVRGAGSDESREWTSDGHAVPRTNGTQVAVNARQVAGCQHCGVFVPEGESHPWGVPESEESSA